nr:DUF4037 domain-containing protein [Streptomyces sp. YSPA8]
MISGPEFLPGVELSRLLYEEGVRPLLREVFPGLPYAAALIGAGSEVLGFDTARSTDHDWGPRLELFVRAWDRERYGAEIHRVLAERLPKQVRGWPTHFRGGDAPLEPVAPVAPVAPVGHATPTDGPVAHRVRTHDLDGWLTERLGPWPGGKREPGVREPGVRDWLAMPQQSLAETTGGAVFHDGPGDLTAVRRRLAWYPEQVWRYLLACQWQRIAQREAFTGRCAEVGDDLGSAVVAAALVRDLMRLCLLLERRYAPYDKWLGSAFGQLPVAAELGPVLRSVLAAADHPAREAGLCAAYGTVAALQNASGLTAPVDPAPRPYHSRPFLVLRADRFARALAATVTDPELRGLPLVGAVDQWADSTDLLNHPHVVRTAADAVVGLGRA